MAIAPSPLHDKVMDGLNAARAQLESSSDNWSRALEIATFAVLVGVVIEVIATWLEVRDERNEGKPIRWHHILTFVGAGLIALAVAAEGAAEYEGGVAETGLRKNNAAAQGVLNERASKATADAVALTQSFGGLHDFVNAQEIANKAAIDALTSGIGDLKKARSDALEAAANSKRDLANMQALLKAEAELRQRMIALMTPRSIKGADALAVSESLKRFKGQKYCVGRVTNLEFGFGEDVPAALDGAGWSKMPFPNAGLLIPGRPGEALIGNVYGVWFRYDPDSSAAVVAAAKAGATALKAIGIFAGEAPLGTAELPQGMIMVQIGQKP